jgi:hypothetical protein
MLPHYIDNNTIEECYRRLQYRFEELALDENTLALSAAWLGQSHVFWQVSLPLPSRQMRKLLRLIGISLGCEPIQMAWPSVLSWESMDNGHCLC